METIELKDLNNELIKVNFLKKIGKGGSSHVFLGEIVQTKKKVAIKLFLNKLNNEEHQTKEKISKILKYCKNEVNILKKLVDCPDVCKLLAYSELKHRNDYLYCIVLELGKGTINDKIKEKVEFSVVFEFFIELVRIFSILQTRGIFYRDVKPQNILLLENNDRKYALIDFDVSDDLHEEKKGTDIKFDLKGTPRYFSPEFRKIFNENHIKLAKNPKLENEKNDKKHPENNNNKNEEEEEKNFSSDGEGENTLTLEIQKINNNQFCSLIQKNTRNIEEKKSKSFSKSNHNSSESVSDYESKSLHNQKRSSEKNDSNNESDSERTPQDNRYSRKYKKKSENDSESKSLNDEMNSSDNYEENFHKTKSHGKNKKTDSSCENESDSDSSQKSKALESSEGDEESFSKNETDSNKSPNKKCMTNKKRHSCSKSDSESNSVKTQKRKKVTKSDDFDEMLSNKSNDINFSGKSSKELEIASEHGLHLAPEQIVLTNEDLNDDVERELTLI